MRRSFSILLFFILVVFSGKAQELRCNVQLVTQQIQGSNKQIFRTLQTAIYEFMNNRNWTQDVYAATEKIECNILINLTEQLGSDVFKGTIQVQSRRPVYNSSFSTTVLNFMDNNFDVRYVENETLEFDENQHLSNLTSILAYYAYTIVGLDYDTFSPEGGSFYLKKAETIVMNSQNVPQGGWKAFGSSGNRNRYWLTQNLLDNNYRPVRQFFYQYHRLGMDKLVDNANTGRIQIEESLKLLQTVYRNKPDPYIFLLQVVFDAKSDEFVDIFKEAYPDQKRRAYLILKEINPSNTKLYDEINQTGQ